MKRVLIIGKRGFIGNNLSKYLKRFYIVQHKSFKDTIKIKFKINNYDYVINTSINKDYVKKNIIENLIMILKSLIQLINQIQHMFF